MIDRRQLSLENALAYAAQLRDLPALALAEGSTHSYLSIFAQERK
jgi:hypothetical protein